MVTKEQIIEAAKVLETATYTNTEGLEAKLSNKRIKYHSLTPFDLQTEFLFACESIPLENEKYIPDAVSNIYNAIVAEDQNLPPEPEIEIPPNQPQKIKEELISTKKKDEKISFTRVDSIHKALTDADGKISIKDLAIAANKLYAASGKKDNLQESKFALGYVINTLTVFNIAIVKDNILTLK